ncbi:MAG: T9SS type A sorting domain-containing protein, partial [Parafilimonas sp.]|nr:T9SS type A sorting domain-containing protein [Parafilimonas sp.]
LKPNTSYYVTTYAINIAGTAYSNAIKITTPPRAPNSLPAADITDTSFIARWNTVADINDYKFDVSTQPTFSVITPVTINETFDNGKTTPGWSFSKSVTLNTTKYGGASPSLEFGGDRSLVYSEQYPGLITQVSFFISGTGTENGSLLVEGFNGDFWETIDGIVDVTKSRLTKIYNSTSSPALPKRFQKLRFTYTKGGGGAIVIDDVNASYELQTPSFLFQSIDESNSTVLITGLKDHSKYFYRVRSKNKNGLSVYSNLTEVDMCTNPQLISIEKEESKCNGDNAGSIHVQADGIELSYLWNGPNNFISGDKDITNLAAGNYQLSISSKKLCTVDSTIILHEPNALHLSIKADSFICKGVPTTIILNATGGTGKYLYSLLDGISTKGPQKNNEFIVSEGIYTAAVSDDNNCSYATSPFQIKLKDCDSAFDDQSFKANIFPNPANNEFVLTTKTSSNKKMQLFVSDSWGKKVYQSPININKKYSFGKDFAAGIYFVKLQQGDVKRTIKIVKLNK